MENQGNITRRGIIKTGIAAVAATAVPVMNAHAAIAPKAAGETKVVYLGGDQLHNGLGQEQELRSVFSKTKWRFLATVDSRYVTPELLSDTDLLIITRWGGPVAGFSPEPIREKIPSNDDYMSDELENAIIENVVNRGMGFMALHCTIWTPDKKKFTEMMGIKPYMHGPVQTVHLHNFNQNHPITKGMQDYDLPLDENFGVELIDKKAIPLYESTGREDKRHDIAGWCVEQGKGRIVGLAAGHTYTSWRDKKYRELYWRGAHWAMRRDIPPFG
ncbi:MAG: ThuA domain-containing protein [Candidatus Latescibacterota bacterium]